MTKQRSNTFVNTFRDYFQQQGWSIIEERDLAHGLQLVVTDGMARVPIDFYSTGTVVIQGKPGEMRNVIKRWWQQKKQSRFPTLWETNTQASEDTSEQATSTNVLVPQSDTIEKKEVPHIGTSEAGKDDYFGPLVVAGVYVTEDVATRLRVIGVGVHDSKLLPDNIIRVLAEEIKTICSGYGHMICYLPERYNRLYSSYTNTNLLLAQAYAQVIVSIQHKVSCDFATIDQSSEQPHVFNALQKIDCQVKLEQRTPVDSDIAIAVASIIARAEFVGQVEKLSESLRIELPLSAPHLQIVSIGREIVTRHGQDALGKAAKLHFKITQEILMK